MVELHGIDRAINASAHDGRRRGIVVYARGAHHVEVVLLLVVRPLVVAWALHDGRLRGGLIACWSGLGAMRALSRPLWTGGQRWRLRVSNRRCRARGQRGCLTAFGSSVDVSDLGVGGKLGE